MNEEDLKKELQDYIPEITREKRKGDLENLLATELAIATYSADPLMKIRHIFEAYLLLNEKERFLIIPDPNEQGEVSKLYVVALALLNITTTHDDYDHDRAVVPLAFAHSEARIYLEPFSTITLDLGGYFSDWGAIYKDFRENKTEKSIRLYFSCLARYLNSGKAFLGHCLIVKNLFIQYAMPKALEMLRAIYTQFISPEMWYEVTSSLRKPKEPTTGRSKK